MKRFYCLIGMLAVMLSITGCSVFHKAEQTDFYYLRTEYQYHSPMGTVRKESREISSDDLEYLLKVYLLGPIEQDLCSPFPAGSVLAQVTREGKSITVDLDLGSSISDSMFTAGSGCIALTCFGCTDAETVTVTAGRHSVTIAAGTILLEDTPK